MSMGHAACTAWTISDENMKKICRKAWDNLVFALADKNMSLDELAQNTEMDEEVPDYIREALHKLFNAFEKKTGLTICIGWHNSDENGDRYDDVRGHFWDIGGVTYISAKAKRLGKKIQFSSWVTFG